MVGTAVLFLALSNRILGGHRVQIPDFGGKEQIEKMKALSFLAGDWKGAGNLITPDKQFPLEATQHVEVAAGGTCLLITSKQWLKGPDGQKLLIQDGISLLRYSPSTGKYMLQSQLANGLGGEFELEVKDKGYGWGMATETTGQTKFTMNLNENGDWHEVAERSPDGKIWTKYMDMTLKKGSS